MTKKILYLGISALILISMLGCGPDSAEETDAENEEVAVEVASVERDDIARFVEIRGDVNSDGNVPVIPQVPGTVEAIRANVGDRVEEGELLLELGNNEIENQLRQAESAVEQARLQLESTTEVQFSRQIDQMESELRQAEESFKQAESQYETTRELGFEKIEDQLGSQLKEAEIAYRDAERNYQRQKSLYEQDIVSAVEFEQAESEYQRAESRYESAKEQKRLEERSLEQELETLESQMRQARDRYETAKKQLEMEKESQKSERSMLQAQLEDAKIGLDSAQQAYDDTRLKAPISGTVATVGAKKGEEISAGTPLFSLVDYESLYVEARITERQLETVQEGTAAEIEVRALEDSYPGTVEKISLAPEEGTRSYKMKTYFDEPVERVRIGQMADLKVVAEESEDTLVVPLDAVIEEDGVYSVFVVEEGVARERHLEIGLETDDHIEVVEGLSEGDEIVVRGQHYLEEGTGVVIAEGGEEA